MVKNLKFIHKKYGKFIFAAIFFLVYIRISRLGSSDISPLGELLTGTARRPFIYRIFVPQIAKLLAKTIPFSISPKHIRPKIIHDAFLGLNGDLFPQEAFWVLLIIFFSILGFIYVEFFFLADLGFSKQSQQILPILLLVLALPFTVHFGYLYDMPQLFLFTLTLWLLFRRKWGWYFLFFLVTTLNKETSILLTATYFLYFWGRLEKKHYYIMLLLQLLIYTSLRATLLFVYQNNPGDIIYPTFFIHIEQYKTQPILFLLSMFLFLAVFFSAKKSWYKKNSFLRSATIIPVLTLPLFFIGGMPMEFRVFLEALPILGVLIFDPQKLI